MPTKFYRTRFDELGTELLYGKCGPGLWRFFVSEMGGEPAPVGAPYRSKDELLADLTRYAAFYGFPSAK